MLSIYAIKHRGKKKARVTIYFFHRNANSLRSIITSTDRTRSVLVLLKTGSLDNGVVGFSLAYSCLATRAPLVGY